MTNLLDIINCPIRGLRGRLRRYKDGKLGAPFYHVKTRLGSLQSDDRGGRGQTARPLSVTNPQTKEAIRRSADSNTAVHRAEKAKWKVEVSSDYPYNIQEASELYHKDKKIL